MARFARLLRRPVTATVRLTLRDARVRAIVEAEVRPAKVPARQTLAQATFVDRHGMVHALDEGLRDRLKPEWRTMVDPRTLARLPDDSALAARARAAKGIVSQATALLGSLTGRQPEGRLLEIGAYDGAVSYRLAGLPGTHVVASDLARYYVTQRPDEPTQEAVAAESDRLARIRERAAALAGSPTTAVEFVEDDVTRSALPPASFDLIVSFEVLEHLADPSAAFAAMARLLRPGGIGYHDYNPFFSINGGHSLGTLDFVWGHARLDRRDLERYARELRPAEASQALRFVDRMLNRMAIADLRRALAGSGLELVALLPWPDRGLVRLVTPQVLAEVQREYPSAGLEDLLATFVTVVVRRPERPGG